MSKEHEIDFPNKWWLDIYTGEIKCSDFWVDCQYHYDDNGIETRSCKERMDLGIWEVFDTKKECIEFHLMRTQDNITNLKSLEYKLLAQKHQ